MVGYTAQELFAKVNGGGKKHEVREFVPVENKAYNLWIPENKFILITSHYNLKACKATPNAKWNGISCIFNDPKNKNGHCVVCDYIKTLWKEHGETTQKAKKEEILSEIKKLHTRHIYVNAIDMDDPEHKFVVLRLTIPKLESVKVTLETESIEHVRWYFKRKSSAGGRIDYDFFENPNDPRAIEMDKNKEILMSRSYEAGGLNDIASAKLFYSNQADYDAILSGTEVVNSDIIDLDDNSDISTIESAIIVEEATISLDEIGIELPKEKTLPKKTEKPTLELSDDFDMDSFELETPVVETKPTNKPVSKPTTIERDDDLTLELDKVDLESELDGDVAELDLELESDTVAKITVDHIMVNSKQKDKQFIADVLEALVEAKRITLVNDRVKDLTAAFQELKKNGPIEITDMSEIPF